MQFEPDDRPEKRVNVYLTENQLEAITDEIDNRHTVRFERKVGRLAIRALLWACGTGGFALLVWKALLRSVV